MAIQFVTPESVRLSLSDGQYIDVKKRLTHGESDDMMARMMPHMTPGEKMQFDSKGSRAAMVQTYLLAWSSPVPLSLDAINGLDPESFNEIERVINAHIAAVEKEIAARKNVPSGAAVSEPT